MLLNSLNELYQYLDDLCTKDEAQSEHLSSIEDELFASSYLRGFITLAASTYGDDDQPLTKTLAEDISAKLKAARSELTPQDQHIVKLYWQELQKLFVR